MPCRRVAANGRLRQLVNDGAQKLGAKVYLPELKFCGDNGAMIAAQGYYQYIAGHTAGLELNGCPPCPSTTNKHNTGGVPMIERNPILQSLFDRKSVRVYEEKPSLPR